MLSVLSRIGVVLVLVLLAMLVTVFPSQVVR